MGYKNTLKELYTPILKFQATTVYYYSKSSASRIGSDIVKGNDWAKLLTDIKAQEKTFLSVNEAWKDQRYNEEYDALYDRHEENVKALKSIAEDLTGLLEAVDATQQDNKRREMLSWLSSVDPSVNYNSARGKHETQISDWLVKQNKKFKR
jgi:hypothetical protein